MAAERNKPFKNDGTTRGLIYLAGCPIGNLKDVSQRFLEICNEADIIASEDTRVTGLLLSRLGIKPKRLVSCYSQIEKDEASKLVKEVYTHDLTLVYMSDAGMPGISDPGAILAKEAIDNGVSVSFLPGPCALIGALIMSGFDTSDFTFYGFLPAKPNAQKEMLETLKDKKETLIFYEAPHRIVETLTSMKEVLGEDRRVCLAREMTKIHEEYIRGTLKEVLELDKDTLRGEFAIVVEGNKEEKVSLSDDDIVTYAKELLDLGVKKNDVSRYLSEKLKVKKNYIYSLIKDI